MWVWGIAAVVVLGVCKWRKWWCHEDTFLTLNISKTKRWFIVTKLSMMSFDRRLCRGVCWKFATWKMMERTAVLWLKWHMCSR